MKPEHRKEYLAMAERRAKRGSGSAPQTLRERTSAYGTPDLHFLKGKADFALVGGLATRLYMPERMTLDVDILIRFDDLPRMENVLEEAGCKKLGNLTIGGSTWRLPDKWNLVVVALDEPWVEDAVRSTVAGEDGLPYIDLPYLVLMKLASGRVQDLADISRMLGAADENALDRTRNVVARHRPADVEDLESLVRLGKLEYEDQR